MEDRSAAEVESPIASLPLWKRIAFGLVVLLIVAGVLEGIGQAFLRISRGYDGGAFLQYEFDPYKNIHLTRNWVDTRGVLRHNAQGFREDESIAREKPDGTLRIFLMGASTAYGLGGLFPHIQTEFAVLDNSETIDTYLEAVLQDRLPHSRVEVVNAAIPSVWTHHHLIYLNQTILGYDPDLILFLDGWNDHYFIDRSHDQFAAYAQTEQAQAIMGPPTLSSLLRMNGWWLFRKSAFAHVAIRAAQNAQTAIFGGGRPASVQVEQALVDLDYVFRRNALKMIERNALLLQHEGIPAIFMLQPVLILERDHISRMPPVERELFDFMVGWQDNYEDFMVRATPHLSELIDETVTPLGGRFTDLTNVFSAEWSEQVFTDYVHLTPYGNRLIAARMADEIIEVLNAAHEEPGRP
jgi:hypothetical protein